MKRLSIILLFVSAVAVDAYGQGFRAFSGRNHPELEWHVAATPHFRIMYPAHLAGIEAQAASIAEASYDALARNLGVEFDRPIRIYLTDEDEIANGFAVPIGNGFTNIWVNVNEVAEGWTGPEGWLRKVIAHELAHIFHFRAVRSPIGLLQHVLADPLPSFWTEGLAQYLTETWDSERGDRWLRMAVLDDQLSYTDGRSIWSGRLRYAIGNSQVRFFAEQYGDSTLAALHQHRRPALFGLTRVHDFQVAFRETTGSSHREFFDRWRRHVNVYYNTMAGQMENTDSLGVDHLSLPGQYIDAVSYSPDTSNVAVLSLQSLTRPVRRLIVIDKETNRRRVVAEGSLTGPIAWSQDGRRLALTRMRHGNQGSLVNDLVMVDAESGGERLLTRSRRASAPDFNPATGELAFVAMDGETANVFVFEGDGERRLTDYDGDVQISSIRWSPDGSRLAIAVFDDVGRRDIHLYDAEDGGIAALIRTGDDNRDPAWSHDGRQLAFTTFRDDVPNVFVRDLESGADRRVTHLVEGARLHDWLPPDSAFADGRLVVVSNETRRHDRAYAFDAARTIADDSVDVPDDYVGWTTHRPPSEVPTLVAPDSSLIVGRWRYDSWSNITHTLSLALPYYAGSGRWGLAGITTWTEPLGKHAIAGFGILTADDPSNSWFNVSYVNNQLRPTVTLSAYRLPATLRGYGETVLAERYTGGDVVMSLPVDWWQRPFTNTRISARVRFAHIEPIDLRDAEFAADLPTPEAGRQLDARLEFTRRMTRPYRYNVIHPLDGRGIRLRLTAAAPWLGAESRFVEGDAAGFVVLPSLALHRLFLYGRAQARAGSVLPQDYIGLTRYDDVLLSLPGADVIELGGRERVRGYRQAAVGDRLLFGSAEYRLPLLPDLQTRVLGLVSLGAVTGAFFVDGALVWTGDDFGSAIRRTGAGAELKNALRIGGLELGHAIGFAQPIEHVGSRDEYEIYYRVRAALPL